MRWVPFLIFIVSVHLAAGAHFLVGEVLNATDGTDPNGYTVLVWRAGNFTDNQTDVVGVTGNSGTSRLFMVDCELFITPCDIGDNISAQVINNGSGYDSGIVNVTVTGAGFDVFPNLTLNKTNIIAPNVTNVSINNDASSVTLTAGSTRRVVCNATLYDANGFGNIANHSAVFYDSSVVGPGAADDNNNHYSNASCMNTSTGGSTVNVTCTFEVLYYANNHSSAWTCNVSVTDGSNEKASGTDTIGVNELVALNVPSAVDYGAYDPVSYTNESNITVSNYGNVRIDISLYGYATFDSDNNSFNCTNRFNITIDNHRYNISTANTSFATQKKNLTNVAVLETDFSLPFRTNDVVNTANKSTYWQVFVPGGADGTCRGTIVFTAAVG